MLPYSEVQLDSSLLRAVEALGYTQMTLIQEQAIPVVLKGKDVLASAQTGTGKTAAFSLPLLQHLLKYQNQSTSPARHPVRALILLPTRELAEQVAKSVTQYAQYNDLRTSLVFGGVDIKAQAQQLQAGGEILIATPGRLLDHIEAKNCHLGQVEYVVLDEADRMLDIGFLPDLQRILEQLPQTRTTLLFSATFSPDIKKLAKRYLQNPKILSVAKENTTAPKIKQLFYSLAQKDKVAAIEHFLRIYNIHQAFIFCNSKIGCSKLANTLEKSGVAVTALHGNKSQVERSKALEDFKNKSVQILVATDIAARGLDIKDIPAVFNYDIPFHAEDYIHRIGRTGRAGNEGLAISLVTSIDTQWFSNIEKLMKEPLTLQPLKALNSNINRITHHYTEPKSPKDSFFYTPYVEPKGVTESNHTSHKVPNKEGKQVAALLKSKCSH
jgi:superfamily II DNA/RNA helicase